MSKLKLEISDGQLGGFGSKLSIPAGRIDAHVKFRISGEFPEGEIQLVIPVCDDDEPELEKKNYLLTVDAWSELEFPDEINRQQVEEKRGVLVINKTEEETSIEVELKGFTVLKGAGALNCWLEENEEKIETAVVTITKVEGLSGPISIHNFSAKTSSIHLNQLLQLSWEIKDPNVEKFEINGKALEKDVYVDDGVNSIKYEGTRTREGQAGEIHTASIIYREPGKKKITLTAKNNTDTEEEELNIKVKEKKTGMLANFFGDTYDETGKQEYKQIVTGFYPYKDKLYALVLNKVERKAWLYESRNGISSWKQSDFPEMPEALVTLAMSPGVVFKGKLWLIGGSSFHPNMPGNTLCYFDFKKKVWEPGTETSGFDKAECFTPRMGHSLVVDPHADEIWLMGGFYQGRVFHDIWTSTNGYHWEPKEKHTLPHELGYMMGAVFLQGRVWIGGGKSMPGDEVFSGLYKWEEGGFTKEELEGWEKQVPDNLIMNAMAMASTKDTIYIFMTSERKGVFGDEIFKLALGGISALKSVESGDFLEADNVVYHIQATHFDGKVFLRKLRDGSKSDHGVIGNSAQYFET